MPCLLSKSMTIAAHAEGDTTAPGRDKADNMARWTQVAIKRKGHLNWVITKGAKPPTSARLFCPASVSSRISSQLQLIPFQLPLPQIRPFDGWVHRKPLRKHSLCRGNAENSLHQSICRQLVESATDETPRKPPAFGTSLGCISHESGQHPTRKTI